MCHYCGCRAMPLIRDYVAEHERASDLGDHALRAIDQGDLGAASEFIDAMARKYWSATGRARRTAFSESWQRVRSSTPTTSRRSSSSTVSWRNCWQRSNVSDPDDQHRLRVAFEQLTEHISKEEDGLFPASVVTMGGAEWDASVAAWSEAHPGEKMITD